jgi:hypothetical protein
MANGAFGFSHTLVVDNHDVARVSQPESKSSIFVLAIVDWLNAPCGSGCTTFPSARFQSAYFRVAPARAFLRTIGMAPRAFRVKTHVATRESSIHEH